MISEILDYLYDTFGYAEEGEDYSLSPKSENDRHLHESRANHWREVNDTRAKHGVLAWEGLLLEAVHTALGEADPNAQTDALLRLAATALAHAQSVQRQTNTLNAEGGEEADAEEGGE